MLNVKVLGSTEVRGRWGPIELRGLKQRILVSHLALARGSPVSLSTLVEALWGENPPRDPEHALQAHVSRLRSTVRIDVERTPNGYRVDADGIDLDAWRFDDLVARARQLGASNDPADTRASMELLEEALRLWRGPAFADLGEVATLAPVGARLEEDWHGAQGDLVDVRMRIGEVTDLVGRLEHLVTEHPYRERYWAQLMQVLHRQGRTGEALRAHDRARRLLASQLGSPPGPLLAQAHLAVLAEPPTPRAQESSRTVSGSRLVGRARELRMLSDVWQDTSNGLRVATISGDPGIGKTRLAREFADRLAAAGTVALRGHCDADAAVPYQPITEILRADVGGLAGPELSRRLGAGADDLVRLLPELRARLDLLSAEPDGSTMDASTELHRTFVAVADWLGVATSGAPMVLVIDDLQWADRQTLLLLRHLVREPGTARALLVLTVRDREQLRGSPDYDLVAQLMRQSDRVRHVPLGGLEHGEVLDLLRDEWDQPIGEDDDVASQVAAASGGNPLFVLELARDPSGLETPTAGVRELIRSRLAGFSDELREVLSYAAIMGSQFDPLVVRHAGGIEPADFDELLEVAVFARLVEPGVGGQGSFAFTHELVRNVVDEAAPALRRTRMHAAIAAAIEELYADDLTPHHGELAHHYASAGSSGPVDKAIDYLVLAGATAASQRALSVALQHYRQALDLLPVDAPWQRRCDLLTRLGSTASQAGDASYRAVLLSAARLATDHADVRRLTDIVVTNSRGWWSSTAGIDHERVAFIEAALAHAEPDDHRTRAQLLSAWTLENARDPDQRSLVLARSREAVALAEGIDDVHLLAGALGDRFAVSYALFEDPYGCVELAERIVDLARSKADPTIRLIGLIGLAQSSMTVGDFRTADRAVAESLELADALDIPPRLWLAKGWQATCVGTRGDLERAEELAVEVFELGLGWEQPDAMTWFAGQLFAIRWRQGRLAELIDAIEEQVSTEADGIPAWRAAHALALTAVGRDGEADRILDDFLARDLARLPVDMLWLAAMVLLSEVAAELDRSDAAQALYAVLEPHAGLMAHNGTIDAGPVDLALARMARLTGSGQADKHLLAAEEMCLRIDAPLWLAQVRELADGDAADSRAAIR